MNHSIRILQNDDERGAFALVSTSNERANVALAALSPEDLALHEGAQSMYARLLAAAIASPPPEQMIADLQAKVAALENDEAKHVAAAIATMASAKLAAGEPRDEFDPWTTVQDSLDVGGNQECADAIIADLMAAPGPDLLLDEKGVFAAVRASRLLAYRDDGIIRRAVLRAAERARAKP